MTMALDPLLTNESPALASDNEDEEGQANGSVATHLGFNPQLGRDQIDYDAQLDYDRRRKRDKLKDRFEHIFAKYGKDFEGIGDEIDLENGIIVVDNGHLKGMAHEVDAGDEDAADKADPQDEGLDETPAGSEEGAGNDDSDWHELENEPWAGYEESASGSTTPAPPENILDQLPSLRDSVLALQTQHRQEGGINQTTIDALGMSIARQLADLMAQQHKGKPKRKRQGDPEDRWNYPDIPQPPLEKRVRRSLSPLPDLPGPSPGRKSIWAPLRVPKERKRKATTQAPTQSEEDNAPVTNAEDDNIIPSEQLPQDATSRKCYHCGSAASNVWRRGPDGMMCNACGMYHYRYGFLRPVGSRMEVDESSSSSSSDSSDSDSDASDVESHYSANTSRRRDELPTRKHDRFHPAEDVLILKLKEIDRLSWERIAKHLPARTAYAVQCRYSKKMHNQPIEARATLANQGYEFTQDENGLITFTPAPLPVAFTDEEDELLLKLREEEKLDWEIIAASFPDRTPKALEIRFKQIAKTIMRGLKHPNRIGSKRRSKNRANARYSEKEDELLKKLREVDKLRWSELAEKFPGRNSMGLQKRYRRGIVEATKQGQPQGQATAEDSTGDNRTDAVEGMPNDPQLVEEGAQSADELLNDELEEYFPMLTTIGSFLLSNTLENASIDPDILVARGQSVTRPIDLDSVDSSTPSRAQSESPAVDHPSDSQENKSLSSVPGSKRLSRWSKDEDVLLSQLHEQGLPWAQMTSHLPGRSVGAIKSHWDFLFNERATRHSSSEANAYFNPSLLRRAIDNSTRRHSTITEAFFSGRPPVSVVDLTDEEDHLVLQPGDMRRPPVPSPRSRGTLPPIVVKHESVAGEEEVSEQRKKIPPSVFAPPKAAAKAILSPMRPPSLPMSEGVRRQRSVLDGLPKVPAVFRTDGLSMPPLTAKVRIDGDVIGQKMQECAEHAQNRRHDQDMELGHTDTTAEEPSMGATDESAEQSRAVNLHSGTSSADNSRPTTRDGPLPETNYPETPLLGLQSSPPPFEMSTEHYANYFTPARFNEQAHPYFIAPPAVMASSALQWRELSPVLLAEEERAADDGQSDTGAGDVNVPQRRSRRKLQPVKKRAQSVGRSARGATSFDGNEFDIPASEVHHEDIPALEVAQMQQHSPQATVAASLENKVKTQSRVDVDKDPPVVRRKRGRPRKIAVAQQKPSHVGAEVNNTDAAAIVDVDDQQESASVGSAVQIPIEVIEKETGSNTQRPRRKRIPPKRFLLEAAVPKAIKPEITEPEGLVQNVLDPDAEQPDLNDDADAQIQRELFETTDLPNLDTKDNVQRFTFLPEDADELSEPMLMMSELSNTRSSLPVNLTHRTGAEADTPATLSSPSRGKTTSDINREPDSTPSPPRTRSQANLASLASSSTLSSTTNSNSANILPSSSPLPPVKKALKNVYSRTSMTPGTDPSTLFGRPEHGRVYALRSSFGRSSPVAREYRSSSVGIPGSRKRIVHTPMRDGEGSEDELA